MNTSFHRVRRALTLTSHVTEVQPNVYMAVVQDAQARLLWQSVPLPSYSLAEYLGWFHMSLLADRYQETGDLIDPE